ncbi:MAG: hypothetical protein ACM3N0_11890 [Chloroflexota bacterium]
MPEAHFRYLLTQDAEIVAELITEHGKVSRYSVVLLTREEGEWRTVRVYDNHLGVPHMHRYTHAGVKQDGETTDEGPQATGITLLCSKSELATRR